MKITEILRKATFGATGANAVLDNVTSYGDRSVRERSGNRQYENSIRARNENYVLQFPLISSNSLSIETLEILRNQLEIERATELTNVFENSPVINVANTNKLNGYHNNISLRESSAIISPKDIMEENSRLLIESDQLLNEKSLNRETIPVDFMKLNEDDKSPILNHDLKDGNEIKPESISAKISRDEIKRANNSIPLTVKVEVNYAIRKNEESKDPNDKRGKTGGKNDEIANIIKRNLVFGVKVVVHPVESEDVIYFLGEGAKNSNKLAKLIKFTTGELSFVKDVLLDYDRSRYTAKQAKSGVWSTLNTMFNVEKIKQYQGKNPGLVPTAMLAISIEEVDVIRNKTGIDILTNQRAAAKIFDELFLLDFMIVDEIGKVVHKYLPRQRGFETFTLSTLAGASLTDVKKKDNTADDIMKLLKK